VRAGANPFFRKVALYRSSIEALCVTFFDPPPQAGASVIGGAALLVAADLAGIDVLGAWMADFGKPSQALPTALVGTRDITFFSKVPVNASAFSITTGIVYSTPDDLLAGTESSRWCYVAIPDASSVSRHIDLGGKKGVEQPVYEDLAKVPAADLSDLGVTREELLRLARSSCKFEGYLG
jgi:hypothetical protein